MLVSDWINMVLCVLSLVLAAISVITVVITLRQNHRMIENSTRLYLTIYGAVTAFHATQFYLVLRNFGQSSAQIDDFSCNVDLSNFALMDDLPVPFKHIVGMTIAPNQAIHFPINHLRFTGMDAPLSFTIKYSSLSRTYKETVAVNMQAHTDYLIVHAGKGSDTQNVISNTLQEIAVRQL